MEKIGCHSSILFLFTLSFVQFSWYICIITICFWINDIHGRIKEIYSGVQTRWTSGGIWTMLCSKVDNETRKVVFRNDRCIAVYCEQRGVIRNCIWCIGIFLCCYGVGETITIKLPNWVISLFIQIYIKYSSYCQVYDGDYSKDQFTSWSNAYCCRNIITNNECFI